MRIQSGRVQNNVFNFEFSFSGFPRSQKRAGILKFSVSIIYLPCFSKYPDQNQTISNSFHLLLIREACKPVFLEVVLKKK